VLRQSGAQVRLIVARPITDPNGANNNDAPIIQSDTLDDYLDSLYLKLLEMDAYLSAVR